MTNFTKEDLIARGFHEGLDGNWYGSQGQKQRADRDYLQRKSSGREVREEVSGDDTRPVSDVKRNTSRRETKGPAKKRKGTKSGGAASSPRWLIVVTVYASYYVDPDNLCPKWYIDAIVKEGLLPGDSSRDILRVEKSAVKVPSIKDEKIVIECFELCQT